MSRTRDQHLLSLFPLSVSVLFVSLCSFIICAHLLTHSVLWSHYYNLIHSFTPPLSLLSLYYLCLLWLDEFGAVTQFPPHWAGFAAHLVSCLGWAVLTLTRLWVKLPQRPPGSEHQPRELWGQELLYPHIFAANRSHLTTSVIQGRLWAGFSLQCILGQKHGAVSDLKRSEETAWSSRISQQEEKMPANTNHCCSKNFKLPTLKKTARREKICSSGRQQHWFTLKNNP